MQIEFEMRNRPKDEKRTPFIGGSVSNTCCHVNLLCFLFFFNQWIAYEPLRRIDFHGILNRTMDFVFEQWAVTLDFMEYERIMLQFITIALKIYYKGTNETWMIVEIQKYLFIFVMFTLTIEYKFYIIFLFFFNWLFFPKQCLRQYEVWTYFFFNC